MRRERRGSCISTARSRTGASPATSNGAGVRTGRPRRVTARTTIVSGGRHSRRTAAHTTSSCCSSSVHTGAQPSNRFASLQHGPVSSQDRRTGCQCPSSSCIRAYAHVKIATLNPRAAAQAAKFISRSRSAASPVGGKWSARQLTDVCALSRRQLDSRLCFTCLRILTSASRQAELVLPPACVSRHQTNQWLLGPSANAGLRSAERIL